MDSRLAAITTHIRQRLAAASLGQVRAHYDLGRVTHAIRAERSLAYGAAALSELAQFLGTDVSALRRMARVSEVISVSELEPWLAMGIQLSWPLTWSHLEVIATVRRKEHRALLVHAAVSERMSVRALRARARALRGETLRRPD